MNNSSFQSNQPQSQQLQQIIQLKVQLAKCKSKLEAYKQMQMNYKSLAIKSEAVQKQLSQYQKIMESFFDRLRKLLNLLDIDYISILGNLQGDDNSTDSISLINCGNQPQNYQNPSLMRRIHKLNSLKAITKQYLSNKQSINLPSMQLKFQDIKFQLLESKIKSLIKDNQQYKLTLQKLQKSSNNIEMNSLQQQGILKRLEFQLSLKQKQIQERDMQIEELLSRIQQLKEEVNQQAKVIDQKQKDQQVIVNTYHELENRIIQLKNQSNEEEQNRSKIRQKCAELVQEMKIGQEAYLKNYLMSQNVMLEYESVSFNGLRSGGKEWYSQSGKHHVNTSHKNDGNSVKSKYQLVFD